MQTIDRHQRDADGAGIEHGICSWEARCLPSLPGHEISISDVRDIGCSSARRNS